jgi:hypothetical protein
MADVPEDLRLSAVKWADAALPYLLEEMRDGTDAVNWTELSQFFERAIAEERERCAALAASMPTTTGLHIALANRIRQGWPNPSPPSIEAPEPRT